MPGFHFFVSASQIVADARRCEYTPERLALIFPDVPADLLPKLLDGTAEARDTDDRGGFEIYVDAND
jgi:hypothetical protein